MKELQMNQYLKKIKPKHKYREFLKVLNGLLQLTDREVEILSLMLEIEESWPSNFGKNVVSTDSRKYIMSSTEVNKNNLSKYISKFKDKGILTNNGSDEYSISTMFKPILDNNKIKVSFILDLNE